MPNRLEEIIREEVRSIIENANSSPEDGNLSPKAQRKRTLILQKLKNKLFPTESTPMEDNDDTLNEESDASKDAKRRGLEYASFGRWKDPKSGKVVAQTVNGKLQMVSGESDLESDVSNISPETDPYYQRSDDHRVYSAGNKRAQERNAKIDAVFAKYPEDKHDEIKDALAKRGIEVSTPAETSATKAAKDAERAERTELAANDMAKSARTVVNSLKKSLRDSIPGTKIKFTNGSIKSDPHTNQKNLSYEIHVGDDEDNVKRAKVVVKMNTGNPKYMQVYVKPKGVMVSPQDPTIYRVDQQDVLSQAITSAYAEGKHVR